MIIPSTKEAKKAFIEGTIYFEKLASAAGVIFPERTDIPKDAVSAVIPGGEIFLPMEELIDKAKEIERLTKEMEKLQKEVDRVNSKLSTPGFVNKAPESVINEEKEKQKNYQEMLDKVLEKLNSMK